jgi:hypothetical protein
MRDGPKGRSPLRHAKPSWGGRKAYAKVDVLATPLQTTRITSPSIRRDGREAAVCRGSEKSEGVQLLPTFEIEATALNTLSPLAQVLESLQDLFDGADSPFEVEAFAS